MSNCKHCSVGKENEYGDIWFQQFKMEICGSVYHSAPRILKRNNRYFLFVDGFYQIQIKACPICGRNFEDATLQNEIDRLSEKAAILNGQTKATKLIQEILTGERK